MTELTHVLTAEGRPFPPDGSRTPFDLKAELEALFAEGYRDFPSPNPQRAADSEPYRLGFSAAAEIERLDMQRNAIFAKAKELSGGAVGRAGFLS